MQQLQAWADEGLIVFPEGDYKGGLDVPIESLSPYGGKPEGKCTKDAWKLYHDGWVRTFGGYLQLVLDGTIQVWRPVDKYEPKDNENVLLYDPTHTDENGEPLNPVIGYYRKEDGEFHRFEIYRNGMTLMSPTHWQPLPNSELVARLKGGER
jgi:hypothetical protein